MELLPYYIIVAEDLETFKRVQLSFGMACLLNLRGISFIK